MMKKTKDNQLEFINTTCCVCSTRQFVKFFVILMSASLLVFIADSYLESGVLTKFIPVAINIQELTRIFPSDLLWWGNATNDTTSTLSSQNYSTYTPYPLTQTSLNNSTYTPYPLTQTSLNNSTYTPYPLTQTSLNNSTYTPYPLTQTSLNNSTYTPYPLTQTSLDNSTNTPYPSTQTSLSYSASTAEYPGNNVSSFINVSCVATPLVLCIPTPEAIKSPTNVTFGLSLLRRPSWMAHLDFSNCGHSNCVYHGEGINESTHLVVVYSVGLNDDFRPPRRWPHQLYVSGTWESPVHTHASFLTNQKSIWNSAFNLTATYRVDSDLFLPYGKLLYQPRPLDQRPNYYEIAKNKTKMAAWFVSNCRTPSRRKEYVKQMQKIIDIDIYGGCGKPCPESGAMCSPEIPLNYRYYLSFENSLCTDYVTEKFFKIFSQSAHIVPVVRGAFDYNKYLPDKTFINAANFKSATDLAQYMKELASDNLAYSKYLATKHLYTNVGSTSLGCEACEYLNKEKKEPRVYDIKKWMGDGHCRSPSDL
ncbi:hypothetical protein Btru_063892 [Bulinus truncatus]|nr:hypothetical protein Btru_063892 [Bulinus truncatus]